MKRLATILILLPLVGFSCGLLNPKPPTPPVPNESEPSAAEVVVPIAGYASRRSFKQFGEYIQDRFTGYHVADDVEFADVKERIPVVAIAMGTVRKIDTVSGYGGVVVIDHEVDGEKVNAIYGHLDIANSPLKEGSTVAVGDFIANLGEDKSPATDGERKHLHFAVYRGDELRLQGYEKTAEEVKNWINPHDFFKQHAVDLTDYSRAYLYTKDLGGDIYKLRFAIPGAWEVEYVPQIQALNLFTLSGEGTARERSQIFIRYFDASDFQTLSTVTIHAQEDLNVSENNYPARRYEIEKKPDVADFPYQPTWRNQRHSVTDFKTGPGYARFYVVAKNPALSDDLYEAVLQSITAVE